MDGSAPGPLRRMKLNYRVKVPLSACKRTDGKTFTIPRGAVLESFPPDPGTALGITSVRWLRGDYFVADAELYQNCDRVPR